MKQLLLVALLATAALAEHDYQGMFESFKSSFSRSYTDAAEETKRFSNFVESMKRAQAYQAANPLAEFGVNEFADLSEAEFKPRHNAEHHARIMMAMPRNEETFTEEVLATARGNQIDWRKVGAVTEVKNQGACGSCWAFAAVGNIEGQWFTGGHGIVSLSAQEITSCDPVSSGCQGGNPVNAFEWLLHNTGGSIATEAALPYTSIAGKAQPCPSNVHSLAVGATITGYVNFPATEDSLAAAVFSSGPIIVLVDATSFQLYRRGIVTNCVSKHIDHAVLAVGYNDASSPPYWIVKNSWSRFWGEDGYIRIAKGSNQCLIAQYPMSARVAPRK